jgi:hypothetical protein
MSRNIDIEVGGIAGGIVKIPLDTTDDFDKWGITKIEIHPRPDVRGRIGGRNYGLQDLLRRFTAGDSPA